MVKHGNNFKEYIHQLGVELRSSAAADLVKNIIFCPGLFIDPFGREGVINIRQSDNPGKKRDFPAL